MQSLTDQFSGLGGFKLYCFPPGPPRSRPRYHWPASGMRLRHSQTSPVSCGSMFDVSPFGLDRSLQIQAIGPRRHREPMRGLPPRFFCGRLAMCGPGIPTSINMSVYDPGSLAPGRWAISPLCASSSRRRPGHTYSNSPSRRSLHSRALVPQPRSIRRLHTPTIHSFTGLPGAAIHFNTSC